MKKLILFIGSVMLLTSLACGFNVSTANIESATLARDENGNDPTAVFNQDDAFYFVFCLLAVRGHGPHLVGTHQ